MSEQSVIPGYTADTRPRRKPARIVRAVVFPADRSGSEFGEAWAAVDENGALISVGADIEAVTTAAFRAGFRITDQVV